MKVVSISGRTVSLKVKVWVGCDRGHDGHEGRFPEKQLKVLRGEARGFVVRKYLVDNFQLDDTRVKTLGLGKTADSSPAGVIEILVYAYALATAARKAPEQN